MTIKATRHHDFSAGHRVVGHESKCRHLHGHNYRVHFHCEAETLDEVGRVIDFSAIKDQLCMWVEDNWDHKFLAWENDELVNSLYFDIAGKVEFKDAAIMQQSVVWLPFNPTAENMAEYLLNEIGPKQLFGTGVVLTKVVIEETRKCSVEAEL